MTRAEKQRAAEQAAAEWNKKYKVGQAVILSKADGSKVDTETRTEAMIRGYDAVVWVKTGAVGPQLLTSITPKESVA